MILYYTFKNFYSFAEQTTVDFRLSSKAPRNNLGHTLESGQRVSKVMAVIGPNAGGKTTLIKPLAFVAWFVGGSFFSKERSIPVSSHFFEEGNISEFEVVFELEGVQYRYELHVDETQVYWEALYVKRSRSFSYLFRRDWDEKSATFNYSQQGFGLGRSEAERVPMHVSLISAAAQYGIGQAKALVESADTVYHNLYVHGRRHYQLDDLYEAAEFYQKRPECLAKMSQLLRQFDLGLSGVEVEVREFQTEEKTIKRHVPFGVHENSNVEVTVPIISESSGTQSAFILLYRLLPALETGGLAVIDEMESDLHPHMIEPILNLFFNEETNPYNAQIIFTCHAVTVLNSLNKGQVTLVEKDEQGNSEAWRLDTVEGVRSDDNLLAKYNAGAFGATPNI